MTWTSSERIMYFTFTSRVYGVDLREMANKKYQTCSLIESPELKKNWEMQLQMSPEIYWLQSKTVIGRESGLSHHDIWAINTKNIPKPWWKFQYLASLICLTYRIEIAIVTFIQVKSLFHWVKSTVYGFF